MCVAAPLRGRRRRVFPPSRIWPVFFVQSQASVLLDSVLVSSSCSLGSDGKVSSDSGTAMQRIRPNKVKHTPSVRGRLGRYLPHRVTWCCASPSSRLDSTRPQLRRKEPRVASIANRVGALPLGPWTSDVSRIALCEFLSCRELPSSFFHLYHAAFLAATIAIDRLIDRSSLLAFVCWSKRGLTVYPTIRVPLPEPQPWR